MPYTAFHTYFPKIAERETRTVTVLDYPPLPRGDYALLEHYCDEPGCDCRRVFLSVLSSCSNEIEAVIAYGWESPEFYAEWVGDDDPASIRELQGPVLNRMSPQSRHAPAILELVRDVVLQDRAYVERLETHYRMFRTRVDEKSRRKRDKRKKKKRARKK